MKVSFVLSLLCLLVSVASEEAALIGNETQISNSTTTANENSSCAQSENYIACSAGSRMYQLLSYDVKEPQLLSQCFAACNESYLLESDKQSCSTGCLSQIEPVKQRQKELAQYYQNGASLIDQARQQQMLSHWMFSMIAGFDLFNDWYDWTDDRQQADDGLFVVVEQSNNQLRISSYRLAPSSNTAATTSADLGPLNPYADSDDEDFESCYPKGTYSRMVLCMLLFSSGLFLIWLTCGTVTTAPRQSVKEYSAPSSDDVSKCTLKKLTENNSIVAVHLPQKSCEDDVKMILA